MQAAQVSTPAHTPDPGKDTSWELLNYYVTSSNICTADIYMTERVIVRLLHCCTGFKNKTVTITDVRSPNMNLLPMDRI